MSIRQGFSFKLKPNGAQDKKMSRFAGCTRWVYNQGLAWNEERVQPVKRDIFLS